MTGFSELVNLQADVHRSGSLNADLNPRNQDYIKEHMLTDKSEADVITPKLKEN